MGLTRPVTMSRSLLLRPSACAVLFACLAPLGGAEIAAAQGGASGSRPSASATLEQCVTAVNQTERSADLRG